MSNHHYDDNESRDDPRYPHKPTIEEVVQCNSQLPRFYSPVLTERELLFITALAGAQFAMSEGRPSMALHLMHNAGILAEEDKSLVSNVFHKLQALVRETPP